MSQRVFPAIWCNGDAADVARFYADTFRESRVLDLVPGVASFVDVHGFRIQLIGANDAFAPNPSISCLLNFDPALFGGEDAARDYLDQVHSRLSTGGVLMELGEYPFSRRYAWVRDRFGFTWQLMLTDPAGEPRPFVVPCFLFGGPRHGDAEAATEGWIELFEDARRGALLHHGEQPDRRSVLFTDFTLLGSWFAAMDGGDFHDFTFSPGVSVSVFCRDQAEIDRYWAGLSADPDVERCGWCVDRWGVSWQVVPQDIGALMTDESTRDQLLTMGRIDLGPLTWGGTAERR